MKRWWFIGILVFLFGSGYAFVGPSFQQDWGLAGLWYRLRTYPVDWENGQKILSQFRFLSWMFFPSWGSLPVESILLWAGPYIHGEVLVNNLFLYEGALGGKGWTLIGFDGNFTDKDDDGQTEDDSFWGTSLGLGPKFRYIFGDGFTWYLDYVPVYYFYQKMEKTVIPMPESHWAHHLSSSINYMYDEEIKISVLASYAVFLREKEYRWGYDEKEVIPAFDQGATVRTLMKFPFSALSSFLKIGAGVFWREKTPLSFGVSANVYEEQMAREVRGYHEEELRGGVGALGQLTYGWKIVPWLRVEVGCDGLMYQDVSGQWKSVGGAGIGFQFAWNTTQALCIEYNHPFEEKRTKGQLVMGFVWLFAEEGV